MIAFDEQGSVVAFFLVVSIKEMVVGLPLALLTMGCLFHRGEINSLVV